jgi:hypothetical protein
MRLRGPDTLTVHAEDAAGSVQGTPFRTRDHHSVRSAVSPVFTQLCDCQSRIAPASSSFVQRADAYCPRNPIPSGFGVLR